ncbi:MAG: hypothetical protein IPJ41_07660 [Phycisphaerales bacterium]|nr:hypothetical protein [Phycisphaerales bacterium]
MRLRTLFAMAAATMVLLVSSAARAQEKSPETWQEAFGAIAIQDGGRAMPIDTYARRVAVELTGRASWSDSRGPEGFRGRPAVELLADLIARPDEIFRESPLIAVEDKPLKRALGFGEGMEFFKPIELMRNATLHEIVDGFGQRKAENSDTKQTQVERHAAAAQSAAMAVAMFVQGKQFAIIPRTDSPEFASVGTKVGTAGYEDVQKAFDEFKAAYLAKGDVLGAVQKLRATIDAHAPLPASAARDIRLEYFYNHHKPWLMAAIATILALLLILARWVLRMKVFGYLAAVAVAWAVAEQALGLGLRVTILHRPPVSNTYEAILWMGIVTTACGLIGQAINRKGWYLVAGLCASLVALLFAQLVPLTDQTNSIPAVLRSNYWLIIHVMTIVASYGAFLLAAILGHAYLIRDVIARRARTRTRG